MNTELQCAIKMKGKIDSDSLLIKTYKLLSERCWGVFLSEEKLRYFGEHVSHYSSPIVGHILKKQLRKCHSIKDVVDLSLGFEFLGVNIRPVQIREEITNLLQLIMPVRPRVVLEIGTARGGTLFLFMRVASQNAIIISVDLHPPPHWKASLCRSLSENEQRLHFVRADSHDINTLREIEKILCGHKIDFIFIDGDHSYEGVKKDFETYSPFVEKGGIIALHDIVHCDKVHDSEGTFGVNKFWAEIKDSYRFLEIVNDWNQGWGGIGVLYL